LTQHDETQKATVFEMHLICWQSPRQTEK